MCRQWTGSAFIGVDVRDGDIVFDADNTLVWFESSDWAKRGFCSTCGSSLFYRLKAVPEFWAIAAGSLDLPEATTLAREIFIEDRRSYYNLEGDHPKMTGVAFIALMQAQSETNG